ncbi:MAG: biotin transporter BioY [Bacteroidota bacterium]
MNVKALVYTSLFTAFIIIGAYITIPLGPVPLVLSDFMVLFAGLMLGPRYGFTAVGLYIMLGALGLPIFSGGGGGLAHMAGPTGGYLAGFFISPLVVGSISHSGEFKWAKDALAALLGYVLIFGLGVIWLKIQAEMSWEKAVAAGFLTFLIPMGIKWVGVVGLTQLIRRTGILSI